jgi:hypothetical protein
VVASWGASFEAQGKAVLRPYTDCVKRAVAMHKEKTPAGRRRYG